MATRDSAQLILEVDARIAAAQRSLNQLAREVSKDAKSMETSLGGVERAQENLGRKLNQVNGRVRSGFTQLSFQVGDVTQGLTMGTKASTIFAQQSGQVIQALQMMGGEGNKFLQFLGGPWGIAISTAAVVLATLASKLFESEEGVDALVDKMREQAKQAALNRQADEAWKQTIEGLTEAIRKRREEQEKSLQTDIQAEEESLRQAQEALARSKNELTIARARLAKEEETLARLTPNRRTDPDAPGAPQVQAQKVRDLRAQVQALEAEITNAEKNVRGAELVIGERRVEAQMDEVKAATDAYTRALGELRKEREAGNISQKEFDRRLAAEKKRLKDITDAAKEANKETAKIKFSDPAPGASQTSGFGFRNDPITGERKFHAGIDLAGGPGRINAPAGGVVIKTGTVRGFGNVVWIDHGNGIISELNHLARQTVKAGDIVETGQQVGVMGSTGRSTGVHLDWRVRTGAAQDGTGGQYVDPTKGKFAIAPGSALGRAEAAAARAAEEELNRQQNYRQELAKLENEILKAKGELLQGDEAQANFAVEMIKLDQKAYEDQLRRQVEDEKLDSAQAETLRLRYETLTLERLRAVELARSLKQMERQSEAEQQQFDYVLEDLRAADDQVKAAAQHREIQLQILDITYKQKEAALRDLKARLLLAGELERAAQVQSQIDRLPRQKEIDEGRVRRGTMSPLEAWADSIPQDAAEITEALQMIQVRGLDSLANAITDVITGAQSLEDAFSDVARSIIADIIQMTVRMLIFRAVSAAMGGLFGGAAGGISEAGAVPGGDLSSPLGWLLGSAKGNVFSRGDVIPFAKGGIIPGPTVFPLSGNKTGLAGENGIEAIMPLTRDAQGRLAVRAAEAGRGGAGGVAEIRVLVEASDDLLVKAAVVADARIKVAEPRIIRSSANTALRVASKPVLMGGRS